MTGKCETGRNKLYRKKKIINTKSGQKLNESHTIESETGKRDPLMVPKSWAHSGKGTRARIHEV